MPDSLPSGIKIQRSRIISAFTQAAFEPLIGPTKFSEFNAGQSDRFAGVYTFAPTYNLDTVRLMAWIRKLKYSGTFYAYDPDHRTPRGGVVSGLTYSGRTGDVIGVGNGAVSSTVLRAGDYIQIRTQYFQLLDDLTTDGAGDGAVKVWPTPRSGLEVADPVITNNPVMVARITSPAPQESGPDGISQISISWEQV
jgi:hypothetical protein